MALGRHKIEYEVLEGWDRLPEGWTYVEVAGVACDSHDRVYVFNRGAPHSPRVPEIPPPRRVTTFQQFKHGGNTYVQTYHAAF